MQICGRTLKRGNRLKRHAGGVNRITSCRDFGYTGGMVATLHRCRIRAPQRLDQQVQWPLRSATGDVDLQGLLAAALRAEIRHGPVKADQPQQARDKPRRLPESQAEQHLHRQAGLDRGITAAGLSAAFTGWRSLADHGGIKPALRRLSASLAIGREPMTP